MDLYKFKMANDNDLEALRNNQLWISNLYKMNDPLDFYYSLNEDIKYDTNSILKFEQKFLSLLACISFSREIDNKRLWSYYTDGFRGFVLNYSKNDIVESLNNEGISFHCKNVKYQKKKYDMSSIFEKVISNSKFETSIDSNVFFTKNVSWRQEKEYRFSLSTSFLINEFGTLEEGRPLNNVFPKAIYIGYRMNLKKIIEIWKIAKGRCPLLIVRPNYSPDTNSIVIEKISEDELNQLLNNSLSE